MTGTEARVKESTLSADIEQDCVDCAAHALTKFTEQRAIAQWMKRELDVKYGFTWHVICGRHFGSYVAHDAHWYVYFLIGDLAFLLWRVQSIPSREVPIPRVPISGRIVTAAGEPVYDASIAAEGQLQVSSDVLGRFTYSVGKGSRVLKVSAAHCVPTSFEVTVTAQAPIDVGIIKLNPAPVTVRGTVVCRDLTRVSVSVSGSDVDASPVVDLSTGIFSIDVPPGSYTVRYRTSDPDEPITHNFQVQRKSIELPPQLVP